MKNLITSRAAGGLLAFALIASACGGGTDTDDEQAAIDALQAQVDELTEAAEERDAVEETTTTTEAPPASTEAPPATEAAEVETTTTTAEPEPAPDAEPADTAEASGTPAGTVLNSSMGVADAAALADEIVGPTTDLSAEMLRVDSYWPAIPTLPETEILFFSAQLSFDIFEEEWQRRTSVGFSTTSSPQDAILAYQTSLATFFPDERVTSSTSQRDDRIIQLAQVGPFQLQTEEFEDRTIVLLTDNGIEGLGGLVPGPEAIEAVQGIIAEAPVSDAATPSEVIVSFNRIGRPIIETDFTFDNTTLAEGLAIRDAETGALGWSTDVNSVNEALSSHETDELDTQRISISMSESDESEFRPQQLRYDLEYWFNI